MKKETVLCVATVLALVSCFFVMPSTKYIEYIDFRTLSLLIALMTVMAGFSACGVFTYLARALLARTGSVRGAGLVLVMLCFFASMAVTNDVALITFVPFAIEVLTEADRRESVMSVVILQTIAANMGSMLTPIGNPQNLYIYSLTGISALEFIKMMLPYTVLAFVLVCVCTAFLKNSAVKHTDRVCVRPDRRGAIVYAVLFAICMLTVGGAVHYAVSLGIVVLAVLIFDRKILMKVDYSLILTFICFFIFVGNIKNIGAVNSMLKDVINGNEFAAAVVSSQFISNVPAAVLLSGFTQRYTDIIIGADIGGLGTIIASMASLISYKYFAGFMPNQKGKYLLRFTMVNVVFLAVFILFYIVLNF